MKTKVSAVILSLLMVLAILPTAHASSDWFSGLKQGASDLWDAAKDKGGEIVDIVKEKGPGWVETGKAKVGEAVDKAGEVIQDTQTKVSDWNANQQEEFWNRTEQMINGGTSTTSAPALTDPRGATNSVNENIPTTPAPIDPPAPSANPSPAPTLDPDFVNRGEKIVSEWQGTTPQLDPTPNLDFVNQNDEFAEELQRMQDEALGPSQAPELPNGIISSIPIVGDIAALASNQPEQEAPVSDVNTPPEQPNPSDLHDPESTPPNRYVVPSSDDLVLYERLQGTLFYDGRWYRETTGQADVAFRGRTFAKTDESYLNLGEEAQNLIILDGYLLQASSEYDMQFIQPTATKSDEVLTTEWFWYNLILSIIVIILVCTAGVFVIKWQCHKKQ